MNQMRPKRCVGGKVDEGGGWTSSQLEDLARCLGPRFDQFLSCPVSDKDRSSVPLGLLPITWDSTTLPNQLDAAVCICKPCLICLVPTYLE
jgi:hypothetical protein